jgi:flagellar protein FliO/FliZ
VDTVLLALRVLVSLGVVVGLLWFVQRKSVRWTAKRKTSSPIKLVARKSLGSKANLVIVDVDDIRFVLGVTEHGVSVLQSAEAPEAVVVAAAPSEPTSARKFADVLAGTEEPEQVATAGTAVVASQTAGMHPDFRGFTGSIISLETWKQAAKSLRGPRWPQ